MIRKRTILSLALLATTAACGGGGGGGGSPAASGPAPAVSGGGGGTPTQGAATNFANPQVTSTADGTVTMSADQTSQTATEDENGKVTIDVEAGGVSYHHTFDKADATQYNANSVYQKGFAGETGFSEINNTDTDGSKHTLVFFNDGSRLSFANYGTWAHTNANGNVIAMGAYANGTPTPASDIPTSGSATYTGNNTANGIMNDGSTYLGSPTLTFDFGSKAVNGSIPYINTVTGAAGPNVAINATLNGPNYAGTASGGGMTGGAQGALVGPGAAETNGAFGIAGGGKSMVGSFGASRQ